MTNDKMFDCQQMFRHACAFSDCADFAMRGFDPKKIGVEWYTTPATVNSAFACEVYLKTLLVFYDIQFQKLLKPKDRHKITELFTLLPEETQARIKLATEAYYGGSWKDGFGLDRINSLSEAFVKWRYSYEQEGSLHVDISFLNAFRNTLREACCQLFFGKTWEAYSAN